MKLEEYISEAISSGKGKSKYRSEDELTGSELIGMDCKEMVELLKDLRNSDIVPLWEGGPSRRPKDYGYDLTKTETTSDLRYFHQYVKEHFKSGQVVWHYFGQSNELIVVSLNRNGRVMSEMFILRYDSRNNIMFASSLYEMPSPNAVGGISGVLDDNGSTFSRTFLGLSSTLINHF